MILQELLVTSFPGLISMVVAIAMVILLVQCICNKSSAHLPQTLVKSPYDEVENSGNDSKRKDSTREHLDVESGVTPITVMAASLNDSLPNPGNPEECNKVDRYSGASTGSSPRPSTTICRELPELPVSKSQALPNDKMYNVHQPVKPGNLRISNPEGHLKGHSHPSDGCSQSKHVTSYIESPQRGSHSHAHLPEIPANINQLCGEIAEKSAKNLAVSLTTVKDQTVEMDDYDHIDEAIKKKSRPRSDYDHVVIEGGEKRVVLAKSKLNDNEYAEVSPDNNNPVALTEISLLKSTTDTFTPKRMGSPVKKIDSWNDPYNKISDLLNTKTKDDPYNRIKGDDSYNKMTVDDPYNTVKDVESYNKFKVESDCIDPYNDVADDVSEANPSEVVTSLKAAVYDPYALVVDVERDVSNQTDPYARVGDTELEVDDPYNKVADVNDDGATANRSISPRYGIENHAAVKIVNTVADVEYAKVNKHNNVNWLPATGDIANEKTLVSESAPGEQIAQDEYSTVVKLNKFCNNMSLPNEATWSVAIGANSGPLIGEAEMATPPEPPRVYDEQIAPDVDHYNTVAIGVEDEESRPIRDGKSKDPLYNKLSVRESLASMNARAANNMYEYVSDVDNLYATVDGSSGDGMVRPRPKSEVKSESRDPVNCDYYAEIDAPAPPSLQSLHETAKQYQSEPWHKYETTADYYNHDGSSMSISGQVKGQQQAVPSGHTRTPSGPVHHRTPSDHIMNSSFEGKVPMATEESVDLDFDPNYQAVKECERSDLTYELDPNYETVEEAKSKVNYAEMNSARPKQKVRPHIYEDPEPKRKYEAIGGETVLPNGKIRSHVYEEVTVPVENQRQLVLSQHTYEEVPEVKGQGKKNVKVQGADKQSPSANQKTKKGLEKSPSGDRLFGKKKGIEDKAKGKHGK